MSSENDKLVKKYEKGKTKALDALKETKYISIYVVVSFIEQIILELLKEIIAPHSIKLYAGIGVFTIIIMLVVLCCLTGKAKKRIEKQGNNTTIIVTKDITIEVANMLSFLSPILCLTTFWGFFQGLEKFRWGIIVIVFALGIIMPIIMHRREEKEKLK